LRRNLKNRVVAVLFLTGTVLTGLGWTADSWGQANDRRVGILTFSPVTGNPVWEHFLGIVHRTLAERGWVEGENISYEYRNAHGDPSRFSEAATELAGLKVNVILALSAPALRAAHSATRSIPIVAADYTTDPVADGYVDSYRRPGGNVTGVFLDAPEFAGKWFELLKAMTPDLSRVSVLWDPGAGITHVKSVRSVAESLDIELQVLEVHKPADLDGAFAAFRERPQAVVILPSPMIYAQSQRLARLALEHQLPATAFAREFAIAGGVIAYGPDTDMDIESSAVQVAKILDGRNVAELPAQRPTKIQLVVNLKTAKTLGITIPQSILLRADEVIR
jgi:putative ABC transport system substrate-binding protein